MIFGLYKLDMIWILIGMCLWIGMFIKIDVWFVGVVCWGLLSFPFKLITDHIHYTED